MKILIINQPLNNRGDESAHKALIRTITKEMPNVKIKTLFVGCNQDSVNQYTIKGDNVKYINLSPIKGWWKIAQYGLMNKCYFIWHLHPTLIKIFKIYKNADIVLCAPGGICMGGFQNWMHLFFLYLAKYEGKRLIYYGRSFGPFPTKTKKNIKFKRISLEMLNYMSFIAIRDKRTEDLAQELKVNYTPTVDTAFLDSTHIDIPQEINEQIGNNKYMVLVPNSLVWHYAYKGRITKECTLQFFAQLCQLIQEEYNDIKIIMLPQIFNSKTDFENYEGNDIDFFIDVKKLAMNDQITILNDTYSSDIQQAIISNAAFLIGCRYHSVVFALNNNTPFIALSYEHKITGLLEILGKSNCMLDVTHALDNEDSIYQTLANIKSKIKDIKEDNNARIKAKEIAKNCFNLFVKEINKSSSIC